MKKSTKIDNSKLQNYLAIIAIVPAVIAIMAYEFLDYALFLIRPERTDYDPIVGLGILLPMALMMELFTYFFSRHLLKKFSRLSNAINLVSKGDYSISLDENHSAPLTEVVRNFNQMTLQLQSVETLRSDFISDFSHEFKTPIVSINGFAELLLEEDVTEMERKEYLQIIADESKRLSFLAEQTLLLSKLESQIQIPDKQRYPLSEQIRKAIIFLMKNLSDKNLDLQVNIPDMSYYGNEILMSHIWINLLTNAIKFTPENGTISVNAKKDDLNIIVSIADTGVGMTPEQIEHIFDRFYQADRSHSVRGLGLGLAIVQKILNLVHGKIEITSSLEKGSCFTIILPEEEPTWQQL